MPDLDAIRQRANAATKGPWYVTPAKFGFDVAHGEALDSFGRPLHRLTGSELRLTRADAEFVAHARQDVPALLDEIERLTERQADRDRIGERLVAALEGAETETRRSNERLRQANARLDAVRALHQPRRIYDECGHTHTTDDPGVLDIDEIGPTCEDGYLHLVCIGCCLDDYGYPTATCADEHGHGPDVAACPTTSALGDSTKDGA